MAGRRILIPFGEEDTLIAISTATKTALQILAGTNIPFVLKGFAVFGDSTDLDAVPVPGELVIQTSAGSGSSVAVEQLMDPGITHTIQVAGITGPTSEPTDGGNTLFPFMMAPSAGFIYTFPPGDEIIVDTAARLGLRFLTPAAAFNCNGWFMGEE